MTQQQNFASTSVPQIVLFKRMLAGAAVGFVLISIFLLLAHASNSEWPEYWFIRPLITVPYGGAMAGLFYYLMDHMRKQGGWKMITANVLSFIILFIGLWMGTVLGLAGTMWD